MAAGLSRMVRSKSLPRPQAEFQGFGIVAPPSTSSLHRSSSFWFNQFMYRFRV